MKDETFAFLNPVVQRGGAFHGVQAAIIG
jgi:hypothetical protein